MFRKDVGTFVRLYDFMSQIVNYGEELEKTIYLRNLNRYIQPGHLQRPYRPVRCGAGQRQTDRPRQDRHRLPGILVGLYGDDRG